MFFTNSVEQPDDGTNAVPENEAALPPDGPGKKRNKKRIAALLIAAAVLVMGAVLFFLLRDKEPSVPDPTTALPVSETTEKITEKATAAPEKKTTAAPTTVPATTAEESTSVTEPAEGTTAPSFPGVLDAMPDTPLSKAQGEGAIERMLGYWNSPDQTMFYEISRSDNGKYGFATGYWYSDVGISGVLTEPFYGDPDGQISIHQYSEGSDEDFSEFSYSEIDRDVLFDLSHLNDGQLFELMNGAWNIYYYAGKTMEEAIPPMTPQYSFPVPPEGWEPQGEPSDTILTDEAMSALLKKMIGHWHIPDSQYFLIIDQEKDGTFTLGYAFFEGEVDEFGYLQSPFRGSAEETVGMRWYYHEDPTEWWPDKDEEIYFDVSRLSENWIGCYRKGAWVKCCYAGRDIDDVYDYWRSHKTTG